MNHPGVYLSILWGIVLLLGIKLVQPAAGQFNDISSAGYVCPPCGCAMHETIFNSPGRCPACRMPLIRADRYRVDGLEQLFRMERTISFFHFKIFYPAYFLAIFVGFLSLFQHRKKWPVLLFHLFFLSHVLYAFKHQLSGTSYSLYAPPRWQFFPLAFLLMTGPALFLYLKHQHEKKNKVSAKDRLHFLPAGLVFLVYLAFFIGPHQWRDWALFNNFDHYIGMAEQFTFLLSGAYYLLLSRRYISTSTNTSKNASWHKQLLFIQLVILICWGGMLGTNALLFSMMSTSLDYHLIWMLSAAVSLFGAYMILFRKEVILANGTKSDGRIDREKIDDLKFRLEAIMENEKPYLNPDLSLQILADSISIKEKELSELLNAGFGSSFYAYINAYRLQEVKQMLLDPQNQQFTNFAVAQKAGFSSKSTFFNLFKKDMGMTPGAFKKQHLK